MLEFVFTKNISENRIICFGIKRVEKNPPIIQKKTIVIIFKE